VALRLCGTRKLSSIDYLLTRRARQAVIQIAAAVTRHEQGWNGRTDLGGFDKLAVAFNPHANCQISSRSHIAKAQRVHPQAITRCGGTIPRGGNLD